MEVKMSKPAKTINPAKLATRKACQASPTDLRATTGTTGATGFGVRAD
jgi:hypothetical protein